MESRPCLTWRGISPAVQQVRCGVQLKEGRWPQWEDEALLGQRVAAELGLGLGDSVALLAHQVQVVGIISPEVGFAAGEIWLPLATLQWVVDRPHISKMVLRDASEQVTFLTFTRPDLGLVEISETAYLGTVSIPWRRCGW